LKEKTRRVASFSVIYIYSHLKLPALDFSEKIKVEAGREIWFEESSDC